MTVGTKTCACGKTFPDIFDSDTCTACVFAAEMAATPLPPPPMEAVPNTPSTMLMMDGPLLTINMLMSTLRYFAVKELGLNSMEVRTESDELRIENEVASLMHKMAVKGMKDILRTRCLMGWKDIISFSQDVVNEVNTR